MWTAVHQDFADRAKVPSRNKILNRSLNHGLVSNMFYLSAQALFKHPFDFEVSRGVVAHHDARCTPGIGLDDICCCVPILLDVLYVALHTMLFVQSL